MERETLKELGKFGLDLAKIIFAIAIITPLIKNQSIDIFAIIGAVAFAIGGIILIEESKMNEFGIISLIAGILFLAFALFIKKDKKPSAE